jgi:hypothetical protein
MSVVRMTGPADRNRENDREFQRVACSCRHGSRGHASLQLPSCDVLKARGRVSRPTRTLTSEAAVDLRRGAYGSPSCYGSSDISF